MPNDESRSERQDKSQKEEQKYALKGRGQQGGVEFYGRIDIIVSQWYSAYRKQMAKKWWEGLLWVMAAPTASNVAFGNLPRNLFLEKPGVGTLFPGF